MAEKDEGKGDSMSDATLSCLNDATKGKARKFVMVYQGSSVVALVAYKKGNSDKFVKEAKKFGTGKVCYGTITGKGQNLAFTLAMSDGFQEPPLDQNKLRKYLNDAGVKNMSTFEIVDVSQPVLDEDDPLVKRYLQLRAQASALPNPELKTLCRQAEGYLDADQENKAKEKIDELEAALQEAGANTVPQTTSSTSPTTTSTSPPTTSSTSDDAAYAEDASKFTERLKSLLPEINKASDSKEVGLLTKLARELGQKREFKQAFKALDKLEETLRYAAQFASATPKSSNMGGLDQAAMTAAIGQWVKTQARCEQQIQRVAAILGSSELFGVRDAAEQVSLVPARLKQFKDGLGATLKQLLGAKSPEDVRRIAKDARDAATKFQEYLETNELVDACENNPFDIDTDLRVGLAVALLQVDKCLATTLAN